MPCYSYKPYKYFHPYNSKRRHTKILVGIVHRSPLQVHFPFEKHKTRVID